MPTLSLLLLLLPYRRWPACCQYSLTLCHCVGMQRHAGTRLQFKNRYVFVTAVATLAALCSFAVPFLRLSDYDALQDMFSTEGVGYGTQHEWKYPTPILSMMVYVGIRVVLLALSVALPLPSGLFLPVFSCGAVLGRLYGEVLKAFFPHSGILPAAYAVVGAAATTASVTHTISTAVVTLELTGQVQHTLPILVAVLMAYAVSSACRAPRPLLPLPLTWAAAGMVSISIYDVMLALKGLPYLATAHSSQMYNKTAQDVMHTDVPYLTLSSTYLDAERMLSTLEAADESQGLGVYNIAVVNNDSECLLLVRCGALIFVAPSPRSLARLRPRAHGANAGRCTARITPAQRGAHGLGVQHAAQSASDTLAVRNFAGVGDGRAQE